MRSATLLVLPLVILTGVACGLEEGARFGRSGVAAGRVRVQVADDPVELDPARARTPLERALARQLFSGLVEIVDGQAKPSLATSWALGVDPADGRRHLRLPLRPDARFSDGTTLSAGDVVWSWQRALRPSTAAADLRPLGVVDGGSELARGALLRVARDGVRGRPAPYPLYRDGPGEPLVDEALLAGSPVRVLDTNARTPCCAVAVPLHTTADKGSAAPGALLAGEVAFVVGARDIVGKGGRLTRYLRLRAPAGASGWAPSDDVAIQIPSTGLVHVVDRGGVLPTLRAGPDEDAPARVTLQDDDVVELVERGPEHCLVVDVRSGRSGWLPASNIDDTVRERRWFFIEAAGGTRTWLPEQDLAFDPGLLGVRATDERTLDVIIAPEADGLDLAALLAQLAEPVLRPVPPRLVEEEGRAWTAPERMATSGPFTLVDRVPERSVTLGRSTTSFERDRAQVDRVAVLVVKRQTTALHLYRAGDVDVLLDGSLPTDLAPTLARASDFVRGPAGGALVAPEIRHFDPSALELRGVTVVAP